MSRPPSGALVYWRLKAKIPCGWLFGYVTYLPDGLLRMGYFSGDTTSKRIVSDSEIEWKPHDN